MLLQVMQLVEDLRVSTRELLNESDWVNNEIKRFVVEKMEAISFLAGFPEWVSNVSTLDDYYDKVRVRDVANGHSVCNYSVIIVSLLYVRRAVVSCGVNHTN
jgi:predicted metalloendopeptidase